MNPVNSNVFFVFKCVCGGFVLLSIVTMETSRQTPGARVRSGCELLWG